MAVNKVDYEVLTSGVSVYANQAEALDEVIQAFVIIIFFSLPKA